MKPEPEVPKPCNSNETSMYSAIQFFVNVSICPNLELCGSDLEILSHDGEMEFDNNGILICSAQCRYLCIQWRQSLFEIPGSV